MDKQKQIEGMAKIMDIDCGECDTCGYYDSKEINCTCLFRARELYNAGYRKIPEGAVVLTQEEWAEHCEQFAKAMYQKEVNVRKETAEKFAEKIFELFPEDKNLTYIHRRTVDKICNEIKDES